MNKPKPANAMNPTTTPAAQSRTYAVCPHCEHPNIHVEGGRLCEHYASPNDRERCLGSRAEAISIRTGAIERSSIEYATELQAAKGAAFSDGSMEPFKPSFRTWRFSGIQFIAVPFDRNSDQIMDEHGNNYGSWMDTATFRQRQQSGVISNWQALGRAHLNIVCDR